MLFKKMLRDLKNNKSQFITIFLMVFLAVFAFSGIHAYMDGMTESSNSYYEKQNLEDLWATGNITEDDLEKLKSLDNIKDAERKITTKATVLNSKDYKDPSKNKPLSDLSLECNFIESNNINKFYVIKGEKYEKGKKGIYIDYYLADKIGIKLGDTLKLSMNGTQFEEKVIGLIEVPDHVYFIKDDSSIFPTHIDYGFAYLDIGEYPLENLQFPYAIIDVDDTSKISETKKQIKENIKDIVAITGRNEDISWKGFQDEAEEGQTYSGIFSGLFVFIAILSVVTTMNRFIHKERTQIGTLKALGIKRSRITFAYVSYGLFISIIAGILGMIAGNIIVGKTFLNLEVEYFEMPECKIAVKPIVYYVTGAVILGITLVSYLSCRKVLKEPAAEALRVERPKIKVKQNSIWTKKPFNKLSFGTIWNLRDIGRSKIRTLMALVGIAGCTMLVIVALGMYDSMKAYLDWEFDVICNFKYKLGLSENYTDLEYAEITEKYGDSSSENVAVEYKKGNDIIVKELTVNDSKGLLVTTDHNRRPFKMRDDGIYITEKMASLEGLKIGDTVEWHIISNSTWYKSKIVGFNRDPQTQQFNCTRKYFESLEEAKYRPDAVYTNSDLKNIKEIPGVNTIQTVTNLKDGLDSMLEMMYTVITMLIVISIILAVVIIYNLGVLSFGEKEYQFATLKVLGFKDKAIKKIFIKQNLWITLVSVLIAIPIGNWVTDFIFVNAIGDTYDFNASIKPMTFVVSCLGVFIVSYLVNKFLARKVSKIDMVTSLKANE